MGSFRTGFPRIRLGINVTQVAPLGFFEIPWNRVVFEQSTTPMWDAVDPTAVVIPRDGLYFLSTGALTGPQVLAPWTVINVRVNGNNVQGQRANYGGTGGQVTGSTAWPCAQGDRITVELNTNGGVLQATERTNLTVVRIGPKRWTGC